MTKDALKDVIRRKSTQVPDGVRIISPDDQLPVSVQTKWLTSLLAGMYVEHGITKHVGRLESDIASGACRVWFAAREDRPIASAAQICQSDGAVEIGRAVSLENGVGGLLMLMAAWDHLSGSEKPLVAEVRVADQFRGIPSGEATQIICHKHMGLKPHALIPAFNHGDPVRQESFLFSSSSELAGQSEPAVLPPDSNSLKFLASTAIALAANRFHRNFRITETPNHRPSPGWEIIEDSPFGLAVPDHSSHSKLETVTRRTENSHDFTLLPVEATPGHSPAITECLNLGFVPMGIDRNLGQHGHPVIFFGRLKEGTLHAPINLVDGLLPQVEKMAVMRIDRATRKSGQRRSI